MKKIIDAHIHLDKYKEEEMGDIVSDAHSLICVSMDWPSCERNLHLSEVYSAVHPAFGFHPEQHLPSERELEDLLSWIKKVADKATAIGEVGLPYYLRRENRLADPFERYVEVLEAFIKLSKVLEKPIALHAIYEDASIVCDLLEKHSVIKAHFHWFKGDGKSLSRLAANGYFISATPDLLYKKKIQEIVQHFPLTQMMVETDGPWSFEGPFEGRRTRPAMIHQSIQEIGKIKKIAIEEIYKHLYENTRKFYVVKQR
jgi:TatD DNase family protein